MTEVNGDILCEFQQAKGRAAMVHGCNCFNTMNSGLAKQIVARYPEVSGQDSRTKAGDVWKLGRAEPVYTKDGVVYNAYTQYYYGTKEKQVEYGAIARCFNFLYFDLNKRISNGSVDYLLVPRIGAGLAGGHWPTILRIITYEMKEIPLVFVKWESDK